MRRIRHTKIVSSDYPGGMRCGDCKKILIAENGKFAVDPSEIFDRRIAGFPVDEDLRDRLGINESWAWGWETICGDCAMTKQE